MLPLPHSRPSSSSKSESASVDLTPPTPQQLGVSFRLDSEGFKQLQSDLLNPRGECIVFEASQNHLADVSPLSSRSEISMVNQDLTSLISSVELCSRPVNKESGGRASLLGELTLSSPAPSEL